MEVIYTDSANKSIYEIEKRPSENRVVLNWKSVGHSQYLIVFAETRQAALLKKDSPDDALHNALSAHIQALIADRSAVAESPQVTFFLVSHDELRRDGGFAIRNVPGYYAVYGFDGTGDAAVVYVPADMQSSAVFSMTVDVVIRTEPILVEKRTGLFKKETVFSGYHRIMLDKGYPNLADGHLKYGLAGSVYTYSFPREVVKDGGSFVVKAARNDSIRFMSDNQGIIIR